MQKEQFEFVFMYEFSCSECGKECLRIRLLAVTP